MRPLALAATLALLPLAGCLQQGEPAGASPVEVPFRTLLLSRTTDVLGGDLQGELSEREWNAAWEAYASARSPRPAKPAVDLARERIFAVALGPYGEGCHDVRVTNATIRPDGVRVISYDEYHGAGPGSACTAVMTWPTHIVALETDTYWTFRATTFGPDDAWPHPAPSGPAVERLDARTLAKGSFSGIHNDTRLLLRDAAAWEALWREHARDAPAPAVEWGNESVVAVVVHGPTGCAAMHLGEIAYDPDARVTLVEVVHEVAPPEIQCFVAFEDVYHFVAVPSREGEARFRDTEGAPSR